MSAAPIRLTAQWQELGAGPLSVLVLAGTAAFQAADRRPSATDASGTIVAAAVGASPTSLGAGSWWAKGLTGDTVVAIVTAATDPFLPAGGDVTSHSDEGAAVAAVDLDAFILVGPAPGGGLRPASSSDPAQFGLVAGFTLAAAAQGSLAPVARTGALTDASWSWKPGPVFVGDEGALTQVEPRSGFLQVAGFALTPTTIMADFGPPSII